LPAKETLIVEVFIRYKKGKKIKLSNIEFTEFNIPNKKFYYWEFGNGDNPKSVSLSLVKKIQVNQTTV